jgi:hypothetical protein
LDETEASPVTRGGMTMMRLVAHGSNRLSSPQHNNLSLSPPPPQEVVFHTIPQEEFIPTDEEDEDEAPWHSIEIDL